jgi:hypothetical protein
MAIIVGSATTQSVAANTKANATNISPQYEFLPKGIISLSCLSSATGLLVSLKVGGTTLIDDQPIPFFGSTGTMKILDNAILSQGVQGGRVELIFRNTTGGALTVDYLIQFEPVGK